MGLHCYRPAKKEKLSQANKESRLGFALQYLGAEVEFWNTVIFTDEKCFTSVESGSRICWRSVNTRYDAKNIQEQGKSGRVSLSFWGWMWANGPRELIKIEGRFTGQKYIDVLENVLIPSVRHTAIPHPHPIRLVHDRSPVHMCRVVQDWLRQHPEVEFLD
ncbi:hypothetical protein Pcinc_005101 [Petrolisthes cinctipes]|uniref:Uncharacterized protein n=1 Tax=Petrolisthes cinctipes TaxID=88211 RepID=A0AAE1KZM8_PETCI|nr:hypothetical protein Pcinc_005101 [Petrolisthes cinctipes]